MWERVKRFCRRRDDGPTLEEVVERALADGCHQLPGTIQSPTARSQVHKDSWRLCEECSRLIPVVRDRWRNRDETSCKDPSAEYLSTWTYVCPFCGDCHGGSGWNDALLMSQKRCFECEGELGEADQCPACRYPRGWKTVHCPYCRNPQAVLMPHWVIGCDWFYLECVKCESYFHSRCIC